MLNKSFITLSTINFCRFPGNNYNKRFWGILRSKLMRLLIVFVCGAFGELVYVRNFEASLSFEATCGKLKFSVLVFPSSCLPLQISQPTLLHNSHNPDTHENLTYAWYKNAQSDNVLLNYMQSCNNGIFNLRPLVLYLPLFCFRLRFLTV